MAASKRLVRKPQKPVPVRWSPTPRGVERDKQSAHRKSRSETVAATFDSMIYVRGLIRSIPDFPKPGILFRDITPLLGDPKGFAIVLNAFVERFVGEKIDTVVAIESRGFIFGGALAARLNSSFVPVRKAGRLPFKTESVAYALEYGEAVVEIHRDALPRGGRVVVVDDLLATGGTAAAAVELVRRQGANVVACAFLVELGQLGGRARLEPCPVISLVRYE
jgi:adenine phosphoribosyltransferase